MTDRTYRYMRRPALYPFGYGLSYTTFAVTDAALDRTDVTEAGLTVRCRVTNTGGLFSRATVQVYVKAERPDTPNAQLKGLRKVPLEPGQTAEVEIPLPPEAFSLCGQDGTRTVEPGEYSVYVGQSQPDGRSAALLGFAPAWLEAACGVRMVL